MKVGFYWHVHHTVLLEWCYNYGERVRAIMDTKGKEVETRLKVLKPVKEPLPRDLMEIGWEYATEIVRNSDAFQRIIWLKEIYFKTAHQPYWEMFNKAQKDYIEIKKYFDKTRKRYDEVLLKYAPLLDKLHKKECGCKEWNGKELVFAR